MAGGSGGGSSGPLVVTYTITGATSETDFTLSCDQSYADVRAAMLAGQSVIAHMQMQGTLYIGAPTSVENNFVSFSVAGAVDNFVPVIGVIIHSASSALAKIIPLQTALTSAAGEEF